MPGKGLKTYLFDGLDAIEQIEKNSAGLKLQDVEIITNKWFLERGLSLIGEALYQASKIDNTLAISDLRKIISTRHIMEHDEWYN